MAKTFIPMTEAERESVVREAAYRFRAERDYVAATVLEEALKAWNALLSEEGAAV